MARSPLNIGKIAALALVGTTLLALIGVIGGTLRALRGDTVPTALLEYGAVCPSPDFRLLATPFVLSGGGAAGFVDYFVSVRLAGDTLDPTSGIPLPGRPPARVRWRDSVTLMIYSAQPPKSDTLFQPSPKATPVLLHYESLDSAVAVDDLCALTPLVRAGERKFPCGIGQRCRK